MIRPLLFALTAAVAFGSLRAEKPQSPPELTGIYRKVANSSSGNLSIELIRIERSGRIVVNAILWSVGPDDAVGRGIGMLGTVGRVRVAKRAGGSKLITRLEAVYPRGQPPFSMVARLEQRLVKGKVRTFTGHIFYDGRSVAKFTVRRSAK